MGLGAVCLRAAHAADSPVRFPGLGHSQGNVGHYAGTILGARTAMPSLGAVCSGGEKELVEASLAGNVFSSVGFGKGPEWISMGTIIPSGLTKPVLSERKQHFNGNVLRYAVPKELQNGTFVEFRAGNLFPGLWASTDAPNIEMLQGRTPSDIAFVAAGRLRHVIVPEQAAADVPLPFSEMTENWFLCWFSGRPGWREAKWWAHFSVGTGFDAPWLVLLQHRPQSAQLGRRSLKLSFATAAGHVLAVPLYGIVHLEPRQTQKWRHSLPEEVVTSCRQWASRARQVPIRTREDFEILDGGRSVRVRVGCQFEEIRDDWGTAGRKLAPFWPLAGIVLRYNRFYGVPIEVQPALVDTHYETQYGPYCGVPETDAYEVTIRDVGKYFSETISGAPIRGEVAERAAEEIRRRLRATVAENRNLVAISSSGDETSPIAVGTKAHQVRAAAETLYLLQGDERAAIAQYLKRMVQDHLLKAEYFSESHFLGEVFAVRKNWNMTSTSGRLLHALWTYAYSTGDWQTVAESWPLVKRAFGYYQDSSDWLLVLPRRQLSPVVLAHEDIAGVIGLGRMAHALGDQHTEAWCRYLMAKYLVAEVGIWKSMSYVCDCQQGNPRNYIYPDLGPDSPAWVGRSHDTMSTKLQNWFPDGPAYSGDSTLYEAPWRGVFFLVPPEGLRFLGDVLRDDLTDITNLLKSMYPGIFLAPASHQYTHEWGVKGGYYLLSAYAMQTPPEELQYMVPPDKAFVQDPFRIIHLKALIDACAGRSWKDVLIGPDETRCRTPVRVRAPANAGTGP
ncbi:MAG: hypothetical protein ABSF26_06485 [Thermoguttaceae bacterium]|jgi:hypothetical protein